MNRSVPNAKLFASLTSAERECLVLVLDHLTAKEIAIEVGITHHAVEKRLKRAREKLGAQSSIEAARWCAAYYESSVYCPPDLAPSASLTNPPSHPARPAPRLRRNAMISAIVLGLAAVTTIGVHSASTPAETTLANGLENTLRSETEAARETFAKLDLDASGQIEKDEFISPMSHFVMDETKPSDPPIYFKADGISVTRLEGEELEQTLVTLTDEGVRKRREGMFALIDTNADGSLELDEYVAAHLDGVSPRSFKIELSGDSG